MLYIYVLELEKGKYYIGKTDNITKRYNEHINGLGSFWTKINKPVCIIKIIENCSPFDEDKYVKELNMPWFDKYQGYSHVRFNKYAENKMMALHADHIHSMFDGERKGVPILSVLGVLNDDYEGGEFYLVDEKTDLSNGDVIIFPSNFMYPHKVEPITKGTRYSYITWIW